MAVNNAPGYVIWLTGLSGAGKTTIAHELLKRAVAAGKSPILLDGDELRWALGATSKFDPDARRELGLTYARLCRLLSIQGHAVICATISLNCGSRNESR